MLGWIGDLFVDGFGVRHKELLLDQALLLLDISSWDLQSLEFVQRKVFFARLFGCFF